MAYLNHNIPTITCLMRNEYLFNQIGEVLYMFAGVSSQIEDMDEDSDVSQYPTCSYS